MCRSKATAPKSPALTCMNTRKQPCFKNDRLLPILAGAPGCLIPSIVKAILVGKEVEALIDSGASENFIDSGVAP